MMSSSFTAAAGGAGESSAETPALESLFTLPFALHLRPVPHVSYLAEQDSGASSEQDDPEASDGSSAGSNYKAGTHRLHAQTNNVPPHSLKTISLLLERTGCLDAVPAWSQLFEMLEAADADPHFTKLRAFFDARFDSAGRLIDPSKDASTTSLQRGASRSQRRRSSAQYSTSPQSRANEDLQRSGTSNSNVFLSRKRRGSRRNTEDDTSGNVGQSSNGKGRLRAPEIIVVGRDDAEPRNVRFKIRLDLHSIGLAPPPPQAPIVARDSTRSTFSKTLGSSPSKSGGALEMQRVLSNTSSDHSHSERLSLRPVTSPDSMHSRTFSDGSDEHLRRRGSSDAHFTSPSRTSSRPRPAKKASRTLTGSSANANSIASDFGTSPDSSGAQRNRGTGGLFGSFSSRNGDGPRRPSMIQRLMDFKGARMATTRSKDSASNFSNPSVEEIHKDSNLGGGLVRTISPSSPSGGEAPAWSDFSSMGPSRRLRSQTEASDMSNEEALDLGDDESSIASSQQHVSSLTKRRASSSAGAMALSGYKPGPDMRPVQEGAVFASEHDEGDALSANGDTSNVDSQSALANGGDFLSLLRKAANTSLTLRTTLRPQMTSPARTPKGSTSAGSGHYPGSQTPPGSVDLEDQERAEALLAPFRNGDASSWWLSGSVDPLPISIACALSQALGWNGIMELCYGQDSRGVRDGSYLPLGRAAEIDRKQQAEKQRVASWAHTVAGVERSPELSRERTGLRSDDSSEAEAREKLASLAVTMVGDQGSDAVAPSESASAMGGDKESAGVKNVRKISDWLKKKATQDVREEEVKEEGLTFAMPFAASATRTWQDWAELTRSISDWLLEYEAVRVRSGMAGEVGHEVSKDVQTSAPHTDSGFIETNFDSNKVRYSTNASYRVPYCVVKDALSKHNCFRRRHGIPEGLPIGPDGEEVGDYRWARKRLSPNHLATSSTLAVTSLAHCMQQLATADWTHASAWELDYLEMCVFRSPVVSRRFPSPGSSIVPSSQTFQPAEDDEQARKRAMPCPYPSATGAWSATDWLHWLRQIRDGMIVVPAVSWQAWWTLIAVLNGGDGTDRALDVQLKAEEESFSALDDLDAVFL